VAVTARQTVSVANVAAGNLKFRPAASANGMNYASFTFQVKKHTRFWHWVWRSLVLLFAGVTQLKTTHIASAEQVDELG